MHSKKKNAIYNEINQSIENNLDITQLREIKDKGIKKYKTTQNTFKMF